MTEDGIRALLEWAGAVEIRTDEDNTHSYGYGFAPDI
jgi:hypothetical protein